MSECDCVGFGLLVSASGTLVECLLWPWATEWRSKKLGLISHMMQACLSFRLFVNDKQIMDYFYNLFITCLYIFGWMYVQLRHRSLPGFTKNISICVKKFLKSVLQSGTTLGWVTTELTSLNGLAIYSHLFANQNRLVALHNFDLLKITSFISQSFVHKTTLLMLYVYSKNFNSVVRYLFLPLFFLLLIM